LKKILGSLNPEQQRAVTHKSGPLLVLAGAGSGKTRVLTHRIAYFIHQGKDPRRIMAVTFTNKAANEMRERISRILGENSLKGFLWIGTFHGICLKILKMEITRLGYRQRFTIYDENDQKGLIKDCLKHLKMDEKKYNPSVVAGIISRAKDGLLDDKAYRKETVTYFEKLVAGIYELYQARLKSANAVDFGDLIMLTVRLFHEHKSVLQKYQDRFKYLFIDEYQDTNHAQYQFIKLIAGIRHNVFSVGDPDQSIFRWRGADINNILSFEKDFQNAAVIKLEQNYRSTKNILDASNSLIRRNTMRKHKRLWTDNEQGQKITCFQSDDGLDEAGYIAEKIKELTERGKRLSDIVVFYRLHAQSRLIEDAFRLRGMPYVIVGGVRFYDRREIRDVLSYLRLIDSQSDLVSLKRIINVPRRGIGKIAMKSLQEHAENNNMTLFDAMRTAKKAKGITSRIADTAHNFTSMILKLKKYGSISRTVRGILADTGYVDSLLSEGTEEGRMRAENAGELVSAVVQFEKSNPGAGLHEFLEEVALITNVDRWDDKKNALTMMTLHSAKGLEFPVCFIAGMEESICPHFGSRGENMDELEEERRLCYVGMTRAKEKLFLTCANSRMIYGRWIDNEPSRFLGEIDEECLEPEELY
jgi:DNA helicase-2/ATP-dependent DNA helicase PcrA